MDGAYHELLMGLASNSPFLGWMIYSYMQTNKQLEKTREESKTEMKEIRKESKEEEEDIEQETTVRLCQSLIYWEVDTIQKQLNQLIR